MNSEQIHKKVEDTFNAIEGIERAEMPPFFYTRLQAKLNNQPSPSWWQQLVATATKPVFATVTLSFFLLMNIATITVVMKDKKKNAEVASSATLQGFAQEYNLSVSTVYSDKMVKQ